MTEDLRLTRNVMHEKWTELDAHGVFYPSDSHRASILDGLGASWGVNGIINIFDLVTVANHIRDNTYDRLADANADGVINVLDLIALQ